METLAQRYVQKGVWKLAPPRVLLVLIRDLNRQLQKYPYAIGLWV